MNLFLRATNQRRFDTLGANVGVLGTNPVGSFDDLGLAPPRCLKTVDTNTLHFCTVVWKVRKNIMPNLPSASPA